MGLTDDTEVVIYGDHLAMAAISDLTAERNLTMFLPMRPQDEAWKRGHGKSSMTYYDLAPTIMNLLNIDYYPPFPFGADLYGPDVGRYPLEDDLRMVYGLETGDVDLSRVYCNSKRALCQGNEF
jgi:phosphoglycerol transferase MdoB-like AlkP superfamily enzyme